MFIHILSKDAREHRVAIMLAIALIVINVLGSDRLEGESAAVVELFSMAAWAAVVARLVHSEAIPGDRQYWLTRPVPHSALLGAKVLGTIVFLHIPQFIVDVAALIVHGFSPVEHLGGLIWKQGLSFVAWTLPLLALATVTRTFAQYAVTLLGIGAAGIFGNVLLAHADFYWAGMHWTKGLAERLALLGAAAAIVWLQYFRRRTLESRLLIGAGLSAICIVAIFSPWSVAYGIQQFVNPARIERSVLRPVFDPSRSVPLDSLGYLRNRKDVNIMLPITWNGLPEGAEVIPDRTEATIRLPNGETLRPAARSSLNWPWHPGFSWANFAMHEDLLERVGAQPVDLDLRLFVTVYGRPRTYRMPSRTSGEMVPEVGQCSTSQGRHGFTLNCQAALQNTRLILTRLRDVIPGDQLAWNRLSFELSYTPLPTELWMGKPFRTAQRVMPSLPVDSRAEVEFLVREPVGHVEVPMTVQVKLSEFAVRR